MRLGIDFGTTRTVVAACDRGNYPVISFNTPNGDTQEFFPSVVAERAGELCFGFEALAHRGDPEWALCFSFKRWLSASDATPGRRVRIGSTEIDLLALITRYLEALRQALLHESNLPRGKPKNGSSELLEATVATPANAFSTQRLLTLEAFRGAGFRVLRMLNEPSAAGVEYAHRYRNTLNSKREKVLVYDLGGGTFDVSLVDMQGHAHDVLASRGLNRLGGDDFDDVLLGLALDQLGLSRDALSLGSQVELLQHCRELKEAINSNTRKIHVDVERHISKMESDRLKLTDAKSVVVSVDAYDAACGPLLEHTLDLLRLTLGAGGASAGADGESAGDEGEDSVRGIAGLYVVGGASALPAVTRCLRTTYGRRVKRSPYPSAAIAIGLAIAADDAQTYDLQDRFHHNLGVFREIHGGMQIGFDRIIGPDTLVPAKGGAPVRLSRRYRATHNIGHYRFIECGWLDDLGHPSGDIKPFAEVRFPFDPELRGHNDLSRVSVARREVEGPEIEELYSISEYGTVELTIHDRASGYERHYKIAG